MLRADDILEQFADRELIRDRTKANVLFCLIQNAENTNMNPQIPQVETNMNHVLYDLQEDLCKADRDGHRIHKAFVYGNRLQLYVKSFAETDIETVFYADSTVFYADRNIFSRNYAVGNADGTHLLVLADALLREQAEALPDADNFLIIVLERQLEKNELERFLSAQYPSEPPYSMVLFEKKIYQDDLENYILKYNGMIRTFDDREDVIACLMQEDRNENTISV